MANFTVAYRFTGLVLDATTQDAGVTGSTITGQALSTFEATDAYTYTTSPVWKVAGAQTTKAGALSTGEYFQFVLTPTAGVTNWTPTQLTFNAARGGSSTPRGFVVKTSADSYGAELLAADIPSVRTTWTPYTVALTSVGTITGPLTVRVYTYAPTSSSSLEFDDFVFTGTYTGTPSGGGGAGGTVGTMGTPWLGAVSSVGAQVVASQISGVTGDLRLAVSTSSTMTSPVFGPAVTPANAAAKVSITGLTANTTYHYRVADSNGDYVGGHGGSFKTYPVEGQQAGFTFAFSSCRDTSTDVPVFADMRGRNPLFYIHTGDQHYRDITANDTAQFRTAYNEWLGQSNIASTHRQMPVQYIYDDHDWGGNDSSGSATAGPAARTVYRERVPHYTLPSSTTANQTWKVGRVRFIMLDCRAARASGTMLGSTQKTWLLNLLNNPDTPLTFIISSVAWIGGSSDDWQGFGSERSDIAAAITSNASQSKVVFLCGDAHMLAYDNGSNSAGGAAVWHAASLSRSGSVKGGPYSGGTSAGRDRYGFVTVQDTGSQVTATFQGINNGSTWGTHTVTASATPIVGKRVNVAAVQLTAPPSTNAPRVRVAAVEVATSGVTQQVAVSNVEVVVNGATAVPHPWWVYRNGTWRQAALHRFSGGRWKQVV